MSRSIHLQVGCSEEKHKKQGNQNFKYVDPFIKQASNSTCRFMHRTAIASISMLNITSIFLSEKQLPL